MLSILCSTYNAEAGTKQEKQQYGGSWNVGVLEITKDIMGG